MAVYGGFFVIGKLMQHAIPFLINVQDIKLFFDKIDRIFCQCQRFMEYEYEQATWIFLKYNDG